MKNENTLTLSPTEGDWRWDGNPSDYDPQEEAPWLITKEGGQIITGEIKIKNSIDASIISASKDMYEAIKEMIAENPTGRYAKLRKAIAKAEGK